MKRLVVVVAVFAGACGGDLDPPWQLDHDRIVAVRATPPAILAGESAVLDGLLAVKGGPTVEQAPLAVTVISPESMMTAVSQDGDGNWIVTAPDDTAIAAARAELALPDGAPVPLQLGLAYSETLVGLKAVRLGESAQNPTLAVPTVNGAPAPEPSAEIVIGKLVDVPVAIEAAETDEVNWFTSCGTMHDFDLPSGYIRVEEEDPTEGEFAVVVRDEVGGVGWQVWPIRAE